MFDMFQSDWNGTHSKGDIQIRLIQRQPIILQENL